MSKTVATISLVFDSDKPINELAIKMPDYADILSVQSKNDKPYTFQVNFMASSKMFTSNLWREYLFLVCKCSYTDVDIDDYQYIGTINVSNDAFAVFYKKGLIV